MTLRRFLTSFCSFHKSQSYKPFFVRLHAVNIPDHVSRSFSLNASGIRFPVAIHISDMHVAQSPLARVFEFEYRGAWPVRISVACWLFVLDVKLDYPLSRQAMCKKVRVEILTNEGCRRCYAHTAGIPWNDANITLAGMGTRRFNSAVPWRQNEDV
ncbi:hypothetical protein L208DRAFT_521072 [Tricholoma matsutake]|nr:hypothetical protein L208DRAFT_521072 [Tricholoma matsutake 945]